MPVVLPMRSTSQASGMTIAATRSVSRVPQAPCTTASTAAAWRSTPAMTPQWSTPSPTTQRMMGIEIMVRTQATISQ